VTDGPVGSRADLLRLTNVFPTFAPDVAARWVRNRVFLVVGAAATVAGGVIAAVAGPTDWGHGSWTAAFVVLVVGVAQIVLGLVQAALAPRLLSQQMVWAEFALWNLGCAGVIAGTQVDATVVVAVGSLLFLGALAIAAGAVRAQSELSGTPRTLLTVYRVLLVVLLVSVFIGIILSLVGS
jgi:hypothetical protein